MNIRIFRKDQETLARAFVAKKHVAGVLAELHVEWNRLVVWYR